VGTKRLGTLPGFPAMFSRGEPAGFAGGAPSREGLGTLPGFPSRLSARRHRFLNDGVKIPTAAASMQVIGEMSR
jgi:hypothetical protein